ncbi:MAG: GxxExxY protein [Verrucomicrobia bacterium]|nr:GxxExxY protein [Verrucomicrobiota bacterium]
MSELLLKDEVYRVIGCAFEVYNHLGCGFLEPVYQEALELELTAQAIPFEVQPRIRIHYKGQLLKKDYVADLIVIGQILVELKAEERLIPRDEAQLINYLKATRLRVGLLVNFGSHPKLEWKRLVN